MAGPSAAGDAVELADVESGALNEFYDGPSSSPTVLQQGSSNPNVQFSRSLNLAWIGLQTNTFAPPFNNQLAREALAYCLDRPDLVQGIEGGYFKPTYVLSGSNEDYLPPTGTKAPPGYYNYDPAKGEAIVKQLGGLSFSFLTSSSPQNLLVAEALGGQFQACGMQVKYNPVSTSLATQLKNQGNYQIATANNGGYFNPYPAVSAFSLPTSSTNKYGFSNATITNLIDSTGYTNNPVALKKIWTRVYYLEDQLALNIPVMSDTNFYFSTPNLKGVTYSANVSFFNNAWLT